MTDEGRKEWEIFRAVIKEVRILISQGFNPSTIACPFCQNLMDFSTYSNHLGIVCRTKDCCWYME